MRVSWAEIAASWCVVVVLASLVGVAARPTTALAEPAVSVSQSIPGQTLIGRETPFEVTITNTSTDPADTAYNLALVVNLPPGVSVSSADIAPSDMIALTDVDGVILGTAVAWENIVDIRPGGLFRFRYAVAHEVGDGDSPWNVGQTIDVETRAYVSELDAVVPTVEEQIDGDAHSAIVVDFTQQASSNGSTTLVPFLLTKSEPSTEAELLRGVHDHQTVYTITAETGSGVSVEVGLVHDWIPAGIEFLGCGQDDHSRTEEYPSAGPLNPGNAPALTSPCPEPELVETVSSGIPDGLAPGVYTHVVWDIGSELTPDTVVSMSYVAGIPQFENTTDWPGGSAPDPTTHEQGSNLDNNTGPPTTQVDEDPTYTNHVEVESTYGGTTTMVTADHTIEAVDLSIHKFVDNPTIAQGQISTWTLLIETSEYVVEGGVADMTIVDTTPDGTCPIASEHPGCTAVQPDPVPPYSATSYDGDTGETTLEWDFPGDTLGRSSTSIVSFATEALGFYVNGVPVSAQDSWTNTVSQSADVTTFGPAGPSDSDPTTNPTTDDSSQPQSGTAVSFRKDVGHPAPGQPCGNGTGIAWTPDSLAATGPGDRVCFRLTAVPPSALDTLRSDLVDFLPPGFRYEDGSSQPGPDNEVPPAIVNGVDVSGTPEAGQRLAWRLEPSTFIEPAQVAQVVFSAVLDGGATPEIGAPGDDIVNDARYSYENTNGEIFVDADSASVEFSEAHLTLAKGITRVERPSSAAVTYEPPVGSVNDIVGATTVTYQIDVVNDGDRDAFGAAVRDLLAVNDNGFADQDATCARITDISVDGTPGGSCGADDIDWTGLTVPAGTTVQLSYTWMLPDSVSISTGWTNDAGVVEYRSTTNTGIDYLYVPRDNIDPEREAEANTDRARDDAHLSSPGISMSKTRSTAIEESGNSAPSQATIGETISFVVESRQSAGTQAEGYVLVDDLAGTGLALVDGTVSFQVGTTPPGDPCAYPDPPIGPGGALTVVGSTIQITDQDAIALEDADGCLALRFDAVVEDAPDDGEALNVRPDSVRNQAVLTFDADPGPDVDTRTVTAAVDTQVVEPNITIDKRSTALDVVYPGAEIEYTLVVTNQSATQVSTAHDLEIVDDFSGASVDDVIANPDGGVVAGDTITWPVAQLAPGASVTVRYTVRLESDLVAGSTLINEATATASSIAGMATDERTPTSTCSPLDCPGYLAADSVTLTVGGPSIVKQVLDPLATFGDTVTYTLVATFPAHLDYGETDITDDLAEGATTYLETVSVTCTGCSDAERAEYVPPEGNGTADGEPLWDLGELAAIPQTRRVTIVYRVRVIDDPALATGDDLTNTATLTYLNGDESADADIVLAEPDLTLTKRVGTTIEPAIRETTAGDPARALPGSTLTYELAITNGGTWTAYDVTVVDEADTGSSLGDCDGNSRLEIVSVLPSAQWQVDDGSLGEGDGCLVWTIPTVLPGQTVTIAFSLRVPDDFPHSQLVTGSEFVDIATVESYFALHANDQADNPDVRDYPPDGTTIADDGYVNLDGGVLGDLVWLDVDGDGLGPDSGQPAEPGIPGVSVTVANGAGDEIELVTDLSGRWSTDDGTIPPDWLAAGTYTIAVDTATLPPGLQNTFDPDGGANSTAATTLDENEIDPTQDFGYAGTGSIGDTVWLDLDGDGEKDDSEPGIPGVDLDTVWAGFDDVFGTADDVEYPTVTTSANGVYAVAELPGGPVRVTVDLSTLPPGLAPTFDLDGGGDNVAVRALAGGEEATDVDFGYRGTASLGDLVWLDLDGNGSLGALLEAGIPEVDIVVTWEGFDGDLDNTTDNVTFPVATTGADGRYLVANIPPGDVEVAVVIATLPSGLTPTFDADGTLDGVTERTLAAGVADLAADFGYRGEHTIGDLVWLDVDVDGLGPDSGDTDDPGVPNQPVVARWAGADGDLDTADDVVLRPALTGADGRWMVTGVPDGPVRVSLVFGPSADLDVVADRDGVLDGVAEIDLGGDDLDFDFGLAGTAAIGDRVWLDLDADGAQDTGERGIAGVDVTVVWAGFDGDFGTGDDIAYATQTTGVTGSYGLTDLPPGAFRVSVDPATLPPGVSATFDLDGGSDSTALRTVAVGATALNVDFGYAGTARLGDYVWWDLDRDSVQDPGEPGIPGAAVRAVWAGVDGSLGTADDVVYPIATTAANGRYLVEHVPAGLHRVTVTTATLPAGLQATFDLDGGGDSTALRTVAVGATALNVDFGYAGSLSIGDMVWSDINLDGDRQPTEPAIANARLTVTYLGANGAAGGGDDISFTVTTGTPSRLVPTEQFVEAAEPLPGDPTYSATGLVNGSYLISLDAGSLPADTAPSSDRDGGDPAATRVVLAGASIDDADFAVFRNDAPIVVPPASSIVCGNNVLVDPLAGVSDPNGDSLALVPGSVVAPAGGTVTVTARGQLSITAPPGATNDFAVSWQVVDSHGATATVDLTVRVDCITVSTSVACAADGAPILTWDLRRDDGTPAGAPVTITWYGAAGNAVSSTPGQPAAGSMRFPDGLAAGAQIRFQTADGAVSATAALDVPCQSILPGTGTNATIATLLAAAALSTGAALRLAVRAQPLRRAAGG